MFEAAHSAFSISHYLYRLGVIDSDDLFNEESLSFTQKIALHKATRSSGEQIIRRFNLCPQKLKPFECAYVCKYLPSGYLIYEDDGKLYIAHQNNDKETERELGLSQNYVSKSAGDVYLSEGIGYRRERYYSIIPEIKHRLLRRCSLCGYASKDKPWLTASEKYSFGDDTLLEFFNRNRFDLIASKEAFRFFERAVTWKEFCKTVDQYTKALCSCGVKKGDIIPVCTPALIESIAVFFAADRIGAAVIFIDPENTGADGLVHYLKDFSAHIMFGSAKYYDKLVAAKQGSDVSLLVLISVEDSLPAVNGYSEFTETYIAANKITCSFSSDIIPLSEFVAGGEGFRGEIVPCRDIYNTSLITSTSGSTGEPKLVELTRENIMSEMAFLKRTTHLDLGSKGINLTIVSFKYPYGFVVSTLVSFFAGKTVGLCPDIDPDNYIDYLDMYRPKYIHGIPPFYKQMMLDKRMEYADISYLRYPVSGGDFYDVGSIEETNLFLKRHGSRGKIKNGFGSAEGSACVTAGTVGKYNCESVGKPLTGVNVKIVDNNGNERPYGYLGKVYFSGRNVMKGYWGDPAATLEIKTTDDQGTEWIATDAIGFIDNEGFVYISDRERNLFISYGDNGAAFKVYPGYARLVINQCEGVEDSIVVKKADNDRSFVAVAFVVIKEGYQFDEVVGRIRSICAGKLEKYSIPVGFIQVSHLDVTQAGKAAISEYEKMAEALNIT